MEDSVTEFVSVPTIVPLPLRVSRLSQRTLFLGLIGLVMLALIASYVYVIHAARERQIEAVQQEVLTRARLVALAHDQWLDESRNVLAAVAAALEQLPQAPRGCSELLRHVLSDSHGLDTLLVAQPDGNVVCSPQPLAKPINLADSSYFRQALASGNFVVGDSSVGHVSHRRVLPTALPVHAADGRVRYVVVAERELNWIASTLRRQRFSDATITTLVDGDGIILARMPDDGQLLEQQLPLREVLHRVLTESSGVVEARGLDGRLRYFGFTTLGSRPNNINVIVSVPESEVLGPVRRFMISNAIQFGVAAGLIFVILWFGLGRWVVAPLARLLQLMRRVGEGDLSLRVGRLGGSAELTVIGENFDRMLDTLEGANERLKHLSDMDGLLGIPNRRVFDENIEKEWRRAAREGSQLSLLMLDIDFFKNYNDTYGHLAGDRALKRVAVAIGAVLKRPGDMVARYGGEEFVVLLPQTDEMGADDIARAIQDELSQLEIEHKASRISNRLTVSIGMATAWPLQEGGQEALIRAADQALYAAKHAGRNRRERAPRIAPTS